MIHHHAAAAGCTIRPAAATRAAVATLGGIAARPGGGYWSVTPTGKVTAAARRSFGDVVAFTLNAPIVDIAATPDGQGLLAARRRRRHLQLRRRRASTAVTGGIRLNRPVVAMAATPTGHGYWLTASDGGIFSFGDARFYGSTGASRLNRPDRRHRPDPDRPRLLARRVRRRHLQLRRRAIPRQHRRPQPQPTHRRHGARHRPATATGSPHPTAASSASATRTSTAAPAAPSSASRSSGMARTGRRPRLLARRVRRPHRCTRSATPRPEPV